MTQIVNNWVGSRFENVVSGMSNKVILIESSGRAHPSSREINRRARAFVCCFVCEGRMTTVQTTRMRELRERRDAMTQQRRGSRRTFGDPPRRRETTTTTAMTTTTGDDDDDDDAHSNAHETTGELRRSKRREYLRGREGVTASTGAALSERYDRALEERGRCVGRQTRKAPLPCLCMECEDEDAGARRRDWIAENARAAIEGEGSKRHLVRRGNETVQLVCRHHEEYGKTPSYLIEMNRSREERAARERSAVAKNILERQAAGRLADDRRRELISALRREHEKINASYQKLPFVVDTPNRKARKEEHERKLKRIEDDIETLSANTVYIDESPVIQ